MPEQHRREIPTQHGCQILKIGSATSVELLRNILSPYLDLSTLRYSSRLQTRCGRLSRHSVAILAPLSIQTLCLPCSPLATMTQHTSLSIWARASQSSATCQLLLRHQ